MSEIRRRALPGVLIAIAVTGALDACGQSAFSALPLLPLTLLYWRMEHHSRADVGLAWGAARHHALAVAHPVLVIGVASAIALASGAINVAAADWRKAALNFALVAGSTLPAAILTEEGFFRGWLVASLRHAGQTEMRALISSSLAFSLWHVSAVVLPTGFDLPVAQIPVFLANATLLGAAWGALRMLSGSVFVASVSHALWNGGSYVLFGFGGRPGALGITDDAVFGTEAGFVGFVLNAAAACLLVSRLRPGR